MKKLRNGQPYAGRPADTVPMNLSFDRETALLIDQLAPSKKRRSEYLARLVHKDKARMEARQEITEMLTPLLRQIEGGTSE